MTYLQLVNSVLRRLRENEVASVTDNDYSKLIGEFVNDSNRLVEDAWDWSYLRETISFSTTADQSTYNLRNTGSNSADTSSRVKILTATNQTQKAFLRQVSDGWSNNFDLNPTTGSPAYYQTFSGTSASDEPNIRLYPTPDGVYDININVVQPRVDVMAQDANPILVPSSPVIQYAVAFAARERGETGGSSSQELFNIADSALADAIALDAARHSSSETIWYTV